MRQAVGDQGRRRPGRDPVRGRRDDRPGRGGHRAGVPGRRRLRRRGADQAGRRRPRRCRAVHRPAHRPAGDVRLDRREARGLRPLPSRPDGLAHPRHGRHAHPDRAGGAGVRRASRPPPWPASWPRARASPWRTSSSSWPWSASWARSATCSACCPARRRTGRLLSQVNDKDLDRAAAIVNSMTAGRAAEPEDPQRLAPRPDRQRLRCHRRRGQQPGRAVPRRPEDDAPDDGRRRAARHAADPGDAARGGQGRQGAQGAGQEEAQGRPPRWRTRPGSGRRGCGRRGCGRRRCWRGRRGAGGLGAGGLGAGGLGAGGAGGLAGAEPARQGRAARLARPDRLVACPRGWSGRGRPRTWRPAWRHWPRKTRASWPPLTRRHLAPGRLPPTCQPDLAGSAAASRTTASPHPRPATTPCPRLPPARDYPRPATTPCPHHLRAPRPSQGSRNLRSCRFSLATRPRFHAVESLRHLFCPDMGLWKP